jgi:PA14 domain
MRTGSTIAAVLLLLAPYGSAQERREDPLKPGLAGCFWNVGKQMKEFPRDVTCDEANSMRTDAAINFDVKEGRGFGELPWKEHFADIWTGILRLPKDADYTFTLKSHDGSLLYVDGNLVIDHDGVHPFKESASNTVAMKSGDHPVRIEYFQNGREGRCILSWKYDGVAKEVIPSTAYWHRPEEGIDPEAK